MPKRVAVTLGLLAFALLILVAAVRREPAAAPEQAGRGAVKKVEEPAHVVRASPAGSSTLPGEKRSGLVREQRPEQRERAASEGRIITGRVTLEDGTPLEGAVVQADPGTTAATGADGKYRLTGLPAQIRRLSASHSDCVTSSVRRIAGDLQTQDFALRVKHPVTLVGKVLHHATKEPVTGFFVEAPGRQVALRPSDPGTFAMTGLFSGDEVAFRIRAEGMAVRAVREDIPDDAAGMLEREYVLGAGGVIRGRIVRSGSSSPVAEAEVLAQSFNRGSGRDPLTSATTEADGRFMISRLPPGQVRLEIRPGDPLVAVSRFVGQIRHDEVHDVGNIEVGEGGIIRGKLVRMPGNEPLPGEVVKLDGRGNGGWGRESRGGGESAGQSATTGADGGFEFTRIAPGRHQLQVEAYNLRESVGMEGEEVREVTLKVGSGVLRGLVLRDATPVQAEIDFARHRGGERVARAESDENGVFEVRGLAPGIWKLNIDPDHGRETELEFDMPGVGVVEKTFVLPSGDIVGRVVDGGGQPVGGARVSLLSRETGSYVPDFGRGGWRGGRRGGGGGEESVESQADGTFRLQDRPAGPAALVARKEGMGSSRIVDVQVPDLGDSGEVVLRLDAGTGILVSTALNVETGEPVRDAWCILTGDKGRFSHRSGRGNDGVMTIRDIPPGTYHVQVSALGHTVSEQTVEVASGATVEITDVIMPAGALRWTVVDENGAGVGGIRCRLTPDDPQSIEAPREGVTDASGLWLARGLLPGSYTVTVFREEGAPVSVPVQIGARSLTQKSTLLQ